MHAAVGAFRISVQKHGQRSIGAFVLHHPAGVTEFKDAFPEIVGGFSVLPAEIRDRHFDVEILKMRDPGGGADDQGAFTKKEPLKNLRGIKTLPAGARLIASEIEIGQTHAEWCG